MLKINLIKEEDGDVSYTKIGFSSNSSIQYFENLDVNEEYLVIWKMSDSRELLILLQTAEVLNRNNIIWDLQIQYLMSPELESGYLGANYDNIYAHVINGLRPRNVTIYEPKSTKIIELINNCSELHFSMDYSKYNCICYENHDIYNRYKIPGKDEIILADVVVDGEKTVGFEKHMFGDLQRILVRANITYNGEELIKVQKKLKELYPNAEIDVFVSHVVNNSGLYKLRSEFNNIYLSNSTDILNSWDRYANVFEVK